ncbi:MAG TPA: hypothetical protein VFZ48_05325, partial [Candidatus Saccharimonadales bacterium]
MAKKKVYGKCRICGEEKKLSQEHYIPRAAGGGEKTKLYGGNELFKTLHKDEDGNDYKPRGRISQSGLSEYSLCKECNELSGAFYDKEFAEFYNGIHYMLSTSIKIPEGQTMGDYLEGKVVTMVLEDIKPLNIAKRMLVSFCTVEHPGLTDRHPEIRKAILDKDYRPSTDGFALYASLHLGNSAYYGTIGVLKNIDGNMFTQSYAGIESELIAFYYSGDKETKAI